MWVEGNGHEMEPDAVCVVVQTRVLWRGISRSGPVPWRNSGLGGRGCRCEDCWLSKTAAGGGTDRGGRSAAAAAAARGLCRLTTLWRGRSQDDARTAEDRDLRKRRRTGTCSVGEEGGEGVNRRRSGERSATESGTRCERFGFLSLRFRRKMRVRRDGDVRRRRMSALEHRPSILGNGLHHDVVRPGGLWRGTGLGKGRLRSRRLWNRLLFHDAACPANGSSWPHLRGTVSL